MEQQTYETTNANSGLNTTSLRRIAQVLMAVAILFAIYEVGSGIYLSQTTGSVKVNAPSSALITVAQAEHHLSNVGSGPVNIRLKPGTYEIIASNGRSQSSKSVKIYKKETTAIQLAPAPTDSLQLSDKVKNSNLLTQLLPYTGPSSEYSISYTYHFTNNAAEATIAVTSTTAQGQSDALAWIKKVGFDPSNLNIQFITP